MRPIVLASALLAALAISATAHATPVTFPKAYFYVHDDDGLSIEFSLDSSSDISEEATGDAVFFDLVPSEGTLLQVDFLNPSYSLWSYGVGVPFDFAFQDHSGSLDYNYSGPQLYTGDESAPIFTPGTYDLTGYYNADGRLTISQTPLPEPSSLLLLGTGVLGCVGAVRRRFVKA